MDGRVRVQWTDKDLELGLHCLLFFSTGTQQCQCTTSLSCGVCGWVGGWVCMHTKLNTSYNKNTPSLPPSFLLLPPSILTTIKIILSMLVNSFYNSPNLSRPPTSEINSHYVHPPPPPPPWNCLPFFNLSPSP